MTATVPTTATELTQATVSMHPFGSLEGHQVDQIRLENKHGVTVEILTLGGVIRTISIPDRAGAFKDVVLGYDGLDLYGVNANFFGCITGRVANRIAQAKFCIDGREYQLDKNDGEHHLHGGVNALHRRIWQATTEQESDRVSVKLNYVSPDGEEGYPGRVDITVQYTLTDSNTLEVDYFAATDRKTAINLTNHSYFNLAGHDAGDVKGLQLKINSSLYSKTDQGLIPLEDGPFVVAGTPMDFRVMRQIGDPKEFPENGYDHNFVLDEIGQKMREAATLWHPESGRLLKVETSEQNVQLYTGLHLSGVQGKAGAVYNKFSGLCLETQQVPNYLNNRELSDQAKFITPDRPYNSRTIFTFGIKDH